MAFIEWSAALDVLVNDMNDEHKYWIGLLNRLYEVNKEGKSKDEILTAFDKMANFIEKHFSHEEKYLKSIEYPMFDIHKAEHTKFLETIQHERKKFNGVSFSEIFFKEMADWLPRHIQIVDKRYGEYGQRYKKAS